MESRSAAARIGASEDNGGSKETEPTGFFQRMPTFVYLLALYILIELLSSNVRAVVFAIGSYAFSFVEIFYIVAIVLAMIELLRVSHPGKDNIGAALLMLAAGVVYLVLFVLGAAGVWGFGVFSNFEFLMLTFISAIQVVMGFLLNSRTRGMTIQET